MVCRPSSSSLMWSANTWTYPGILLVGSIEVLLISLLTFLLLSYPTLLVSQCSCIIFCRSCPRLGLGSWFSAIKFHLRWVYYLDACYCCTDIIHLFICYVLFSSCRTGGQTIMLPISNISPSHKCPANNTLECKAVLAKSAIISIYGSTLTMMKVKIPSYYGSSEVKLQKVYV